MKSRIHAARWLLRLTADACSAPHSFQSLAVLGLRRICPAPARKLAYSAQAKRQVSAKRYLISRGQEADFLSAKE